jgi:hypothetical protein
LQQLKTETLHGVYPELAEDLREIILIYIQALNTMKNNILRNQDFLLGIEESWDSYYEVTVKFVEEVTIGPHTYHHLLDPKNQKSFYLRPRYVDHHIEGIFVDRQIVVNISKTDTDGGQTNIRPPRFYATGILKLP